MKSTFFSFLLGVLVGVGGYWWLAERKDKGDLQTAKDHVVQGAEKVKETVKDKVGEIDVEQIKEELARTSVVVRKKAEQAGNVIADATANARTTAAIKAKLIAEPGLSAFNINVDTTDGLVTLTGTVNSADDVARAIDLALNTDGVYKVISTLQVKATK